MRAIFTSWVFCYFDYWRNAFNFKGTVNRYGYWQPIIFNIVVGQSALILWFIVANLRGSSSASSYLTFFFLWGALTVIPNLTINIRRLRDSGTSIWWGAYFLLDRIFKFFPDTNNITRTTLYFIGLAYLAYLLSKPTNNKTT